MPKANFEINFEDIRQLKWIGSGAHGCVFLGQYRHEEVAVKKFREASLILNVRGPYGACVNRKRSC